MAENIKKLAVINHFDPLTYIIVNTLLLTHLKTLMLSSNFIFSSHWEVGSSMNCFFTEGGGGRGLRLRVVLMPRTPIAANSHFLQLLGSGSLDPDKIWHGHTT